MIQSMEQLQDHNIRVPKLQFLVNLYTGFNKQTMTEKELEEIKQKITSLPTSSVQKKLKNKTWKN